MAEITEQQVLADLTKMLDELTNDWEYGEEITVDTRLYYDLKFGSIDAVALGSAIEEHYKKHMPYVEFIMGLGRERVKALTVGELVEFIHKILSSDREQQ